MDRMNKETEHRSFSSYLNRLISGWTFTFSSLDSLNRRETFGRHPELMKSEGPSSSSSNILCDCAAVISLVLPDDYEVMIPSPQQLNNPCWLTPMRHDYISISNLFC